MPPQASRGGYCRRLALVLPAAVGALARTYSNKAIRFIVPYPAGGGVDFIARMVGARLAETWSRQVGL